MERTVRAGTPHTEWKHDRYYSPQGRPSRQRHGDSGGGRFHGKPALFHPGRRGLSHRGALGGQPRPGELGGGGGGSRTDRSCHIAGQPPRKDSRSVACTGRGRPPGLRARRRAFVGPGGDLIVDFWHDELGVLACDASGAGTLSVLVGESLEEVRDPNPRHFEQRPLPEIRLTASRKELTFPERCVRYARFRSSASCEIQNLRLEANVWPVDYRGSFESSDSSLNAIWSAAAATMHANMHDFYLDGIRRDALPWHDGLLVLEAGECVFFDGAISRQSTPLADAPCQASVCTTWG